MSYYSNPYLAQLAQLGQQRRQQSQSHPSPFGQGYHQHQHPFATPQFNFYAPPSPSPAAYEEDNYSIEDEERAAIAHLRAIQRRKQLEQIQRQEVEREAALARQYRERELALAQAQREREVAVARAMREREVALATAKAQRERELEMARRAREFEVARFAEIQNQRRQAAIAAAHERQQALNERQQAINEQRRRQCARHRRRTQEVTAPAPAETEAAFDNADLDAFNKWIGSLFGLQLPTDNELASAPATSTKEKDTTSAPVAPAPTAPIKESCPVPEAASAAKATEPASEKKAEFPEAINDLLSSILGLRVDPESKLGEAVSKQANKVPEGLNEFLNQFGLEFFPDQSEEKVEKQEEAGPSTSTTTPAPAAEPTPATSTQTPGPSSTQQTQSRGPVDLAEFLSGSHGLPPFVRDILGNVELAFKERSQEEKKPEEKKPEGKGKEVAEGEKKSVPTPAPESAPTSASVATAPSPSVPTVEPEIDNSRRVSDSIAQLASIETELALAQSQFTFPTTLSFGPQTSDSSPSLLFNKTNKPYHAQNNRLLQLLLQADGVASNGDREVRRRRKSVVKAVEGEIEKLERKRDEYWAEVKERREVTGEISENESWSTGSTVDHEEVVHVEDVAEEVPTKSNELEDPASTATETETEAEKPSTFAEAVKTTSSDGTSSAPAELKVEDSKHEEAEVQEEKKKEKDDKEEGYELL